MPAPHAPLTRMHLPVPSDYDLARDVCSYGYFLLSPNHWDHQTKSLWRVFTLDHASRPFAVLTHIAQPCKPGQHAPGRPLVLRAFHPLAPTQRQQLRTQATRMLRLDESAHEVTAFHALDHRFRVSGRGRLFRSPTLFEDVIKTVTSCNVQWPGTITMNQRLCEVVGAKASPLPHAANSPLPQAHAFPTPGQLARVAPGTLRARCRVGYRDRRIIEIAQRFAAPPTKGGIDQTLLDNPATPDDIVFDSLLDLPGIGPYAAANIMQLLGRYARLPLDTESVRHGRTVLGMKGTPTQVMKQVRAHFEPFAAQAFRSYWFEVWEFYERVHGPAWTWERATTGRLFTAAHLSKQAPRAGVKAPPPARGRAASSRTAP